MLQTLPLLLVSNFFMLCAWYLHLKYISVRQWVIAAILSWLIAFFEYTVHIPANRIGYKVINLQQLQVLQIGLSLLMFIPFSYFIMDKPVTLNYIWAGVCLSGAAFFIFR